MICVLVKDSVVEFCIAVDDVEKDLREFYPDHQIIERVGDETVGWSYDGVTFTAPKV